MIEIVWSISLVSGSMDDPIGYWLIVVEWQSKLPKGKHPRFDYGHSVSILFLFQFEKIDQISGDLLIGKKKNKKLKIKHRQKIIPKHQNQKSNTDQFMIFLER